jgi:hypothetical protein
MRVGRYTTCSPRVSTSSARSMHDLLVLSTARDEAVPTPLTQPISDLDIHTCAYNMLLRALP